MGGFASGDRSDESSHASGRSPVRISPPASHRLPSVRQRQLPPRQPRRRRFHRLRDEQLPAVEALMTELLAVQSSSARFTPFTEARVQESAAILVRYGLESV